MGISIRLINISGTTSYSVAYSTSPYGPFTTALTGTTSTATISGAPFEFDTQYYIKLTDLVTNRYVIENIYIHDSKAYPLYDTIDFDLSAVCIPPTPTPTATPTNTPTQTLTASVGLTPTATPTLTLTQTPTPTASSAEVLPGCGDTVSGSYTGSSFNNYGDYQLDLSGAPNGSTIYFVCTANDRPNNIAIKTGTVTIDSTGWFGNSSGYDPQDYYYPTEGTGPKTLTITYDNTKTYYINAITAPSLAPPNDVNDAWEVNIQCAGLPTPTPTSSLIPNYYTVSVRLQGYLGANGNLQVWQSPNNTPFSFVQSLTLTSTDNEYVSQTFNGTPGYYYYLIIARTSGTANRLNLYTQVDITDFDPGPINNAWCTNNSSTTPLQSDTFQLPDPVQPRSSIVFYGSLAEGCL